MEGQSITGVAIDNDEIMITIRDIPLTGTSPHSFSVSLPPKALTSI